MTPNAEFSALLEAFFTERLLRERRASPHTIASYRDTFRLLMEYAKRLLKKEPSSLTVDDLDAPFLGAFLDHLEHDRQNGARTRNLRLTAIHSFFRYVSYQKPERSSFIQRILAIPQKRFARRLIAFLSAAEIEALLSAPDRTTWRGHRDHALLTVAIQTGLRVSELCGLCRQDVVLGPGAHVRCQGKGRKERTTPLGKRPRAILQAWMREQAGHPSDPVFPSSRGGALSRDAVEDLLAKYVTQARRTCSTLKNKRVSPHVLRHSTAMQLLQAGVDRSVIALWLGHESIETTQVYIDADLALKQKVVEKAAPRGARNGRYKPADRLLAFLTSL
jgi:site-specific recombinase XerD